ncbi:MAG: hypothetical protein HYW48_01205 [Deltaproteobacteria bacterium]|nr:hypothetical protein [Deltaproteobacteria bacterium]
MAVLPGVNIHDKELSFDSSEFPCCGGRSFRWDDSEQVIYKCKLSKRKTALKKLWQHYNRLWEGYHPPLEGDLAQKRYFVTWLGKMRAGQLSPGFVIRKRGETTSPSLLWTLAFIATWRFGFSCHLFCQARSQASQLLPPEGNAPQLYFMENVRELWKPEHAEQVNVVANWCEQSRVPLWMEIYEGAEVKQDSFDATKAFAQRIASMKSKPAMSWLGKDCLSRLKELFPR